MQEVALENRWPSQSPPCPSHVSSIVSRSLSHTRSISKIQSLSLIRLSFSLKQTRSLSLSLKPLTPNSLSLKPILLFLQILYVRDLGLSMFLCFDFRGRGTTSTSFPLNVFLLIYFFLIDFSFFLLILKLKKKKWKMKNGVVLVTLMASSNWVLMESCIDKNWTWNYTIGPQSLLCVGN